MHAPPLLILVSDPKRLPAQIVSSDDMTNMQYYAGSHIGATN
jgi:hypothetical protein